MLGPQLDSLITLTCLRNFPSLRHQTIELETLPTYSGNELSVDCRALDVGGQFWTSAALNR